LKTGQDKPHHRVWYDTFLESTRVLPPVEKSVQPSKFPESVRGYLLRVDLPAYCRLFRDNNKLHADENILGKEFDSDGQRITIKEVDPLFSLLTDFSLSEDSQFMRSNRSFLNEIQNRYLLKQPEDEITLPRQARK